MAKRKRKKWAENKTFRHVFEPDLLPVIREGKTFMQGEWHQFFGNNNPITVELGCGKGEYTVSLARKYPDRNFIGVDVKGHRFHMGAKQAQDEGLKNVAFLRARIEFIEAFFGPDEVDEIWLTFSDPQPKDEKGNRRITSSWYIFHKYQRFIRSGGLIHVKHDNPLVYALLQEELEATPFLVETHSPDVYGEYFGRLSGEWQQILGIRTYYEQMWLAEGRKITYTRFRLRNYGDPLRIT